MTHRGGKTPRESWSKKRNQSKPMRYVSRDSEDGSTTHDAHSIESMSFPDHHDDLHGDKPGDNLHDHHDDLHGDKPGDNLHGANGDNSFQDHQGCTKFIKKTFHTNYKSKTVASTSNETDPEGKTKILTILQIKLPHRNGIDDMKIKVDDGAKANILPLDSFRTMFPHALDDSGYPKPGFLRGSRANLECYNDGKLDNYGSIKLKFQHYLDKSF